MLKIIKLMSMMLVLLLTMACNKGSGGEPQYPAASAPGGAVEPAGPNNPMAQHPPVTAAGGTISGTISLDPSLAGKLAPTDVMYIIARSVGRPSPPVAVQQVRNVQFPYHYTLSSDDVMMQGMGFEGKVDILAKLKRSGAAGPPQPGDMEGVYAGNPATVGDQKVDVVINKVY